MRSIDSGALFRAYGGHRKAKPVESKVEARGTEDAGVIRR